MFKKSCRDLKDKRKTQTDLLEIKTISHNEKDLGINCRLASEEKFVNLKT
jgi:hypothetical protein